VFTRVAAEIFPRLSQLAQGQELDDDLCISCDNPGLLSSLPEQSDFFASFFSFTRATATGTDWFSGSVAVPAAEAGAAAVPTGATGDLGRGSGGAGRVACDYLLG